MPTEFGSLWIQISRWCMLFSGLGFTNNILKCSYFSSSMVLKLIIPPNISSSGTAFFCAKASLATWFTPSIIILCTFSIVSCLYSCGSCWSNLFLYYSLLIVARPVKLYFFRLWISGLEVTIFLFLLVGDDFPIRLLERLLLCIFILDCCSIIR